LTALGTAAVARIAWRKHKHTGDVELSPPLGRKRGSAQDERRPRFASLSAVQQRLWATNQRKNLHFLGALQDLVLLFLFFFVFYNV
jgi:hypothetical protein